MLWKFDVSEYQKSLEFIFENKVYRLAFRKKNHTMAAAASLTQKPSSVPRQRVWFGGRSLVCIKLPNSLGKSQTIKHEV